MTKKTQRRLKKAFKIASPISKILVFVAFEGIFLVWFATQNRLLTVLAAAVFLLIGWICYVVSSVAEQIK